MDSTPEPLTVHAGMTMTQQARTVDRAHSRYHGVACHGRHQSGRAGHPPRKHPNGARCRWAYSAWISVDGDHPFRRKPITAFGEVRDPTAAAPFTGVEQIGDLFSARAGAQWCPIFLAIPLPREHSGAEQQFCRGNTRWMSATRERRSGFPSWTSPVRVRSPALRQDNAPQRCRSLRGLVVSRAAWARTASGCSDRVAALVQLTGKRDSARIPSRNACNSSRTATSSRALATSASLRSASRPTKNVASTAVT